MKNIEKIRERFMKDNSSIRLGNLAANFARVASFVKDPRNSEVIESIIDESKHLIEWAARDFSLEIQAELVELQIKLALWYLQWREISKDNTKLSVVQNEAEKSSQHLLKLAGII